MYISSYGSANIYETSKIYVFRKSTAHVAGWRQY